ncbi:MAG: metallophosphatase [Bacteroidota bacterium]|nr:metallophosphatase [Bacteroidota bacterium]
MEESKKINRRKFIRNSVYAGAGIWLSSKIPFNSFAKNDVKKITILSTNDTHSRIEPFPMDGSRNQGLAGCARRATLIKKIRKEEKNVLLFDAGDIIQGTPYFNYFNGELEFKLMSEMKYDGAVIGNHEFDAGLNTLAKNIKNSSFPFIISNYDVSETPLKNLTINNKVFEMDGIKIGVFGLGIELQGLVSESLYKNIKYLDPTKVAIEQENILKNEKKCDLIICISHLGFDYESNKINDIKIAQKTNYINYIISGHTHTFMKKPEIIENAEGAECQIFQQGFAGIYLGRMDFYFEKDLKPKVKHSKTLKIY